MKKSLLLVSILINILFLLTFFVLAYFGTGPFSSTPQIDIHAPVQLTPQLIESEMHTLVNEDLKYYLYFPKDYEVKKDGKFPLLLFLHGGGESGAAIETIKSNGPPKLIAEGRDFPFLVLAPQNPYQKKWWNTRSVNQLLNAIIKTHRVDLDRIYITGLSRGGGAAWEMAVQYPEKFAAMAVVCGMAPVPYASWIDKDLPIWVFHGDQDESIPISESIEMVNKLKEMGRNIKFTIYEGVGHNSWETAYSDEELYIWLQNQKRK
ncbi:carboxylesterase family protein [Costertonia aggregata]|uniref:Prolyl oligopeptidase family serine peptidase n=1 Tax=Costertonia aggregata TaxID=343403 RepID=A0A7H9AT49_9FLAO|nr:prolyl oligopeptidase family serine peptidase [Costertonia aggregata]QLG46653.1 prolyl oligopeptidase family serine peptidase [Costertonia aggregata]